MPFEELIVIQINQIMHCCAGNSNQIIYQEYIITHMVNVNSLYYLTTNTICFADKEYMKM